MSRESDVECPNCGAMMKKPVPEEDWHTWDCYECGLEIPNRMTASGYNVLSALYCDDEVFRSKLEDLFEWDFGEKRR